MATVITLNPQVLGQAENAHRALLDQILQSPGMTYHQWVGLTVAATAGDQVPLEQLIGRLTGALKTDADTVRTALTELAADGLIEQDRASVRVTALGRTRFGGVRSDIEGAMKQAYADIPAADLDTAGRVLAQVTAQMNAVLTPA
ncbi:hypothetical protein ACFQZZ_28790 [Nocardia sp. GCM10030253]|uniref:hypothetical protein n=1 Tax=Nocardia sp. GCM10030253 TaxID=3273404 RepID=UPI003642554F